MYQFAQKDHKQGSKQDLGEAPLQRCSDSALSHNYLQDNRAQTGPEPIQKQPQHQPNRTGIPDNLKTGMENLSGMSLDHVKVHYNSAKPAAVQAHAYAQGSDIHLASGQEKHLPHELGHVVQQMQGRVKPTTSLGGVAVNDNPELEREADVLGERALQLKTAKENTIPLDRTRSHPNIGKAIQREPKILDVNELEKGDVLHLQVYSAFTGHHAVRALINIGQKSSLNAFSPSSSLMGARYHDAVRYGDIKNDYGEGIVDKRKATKKLAKTGHTSIYIGNNKVIETTGNGTEKRDLANVDSAMYKVMRGADNALREYINIYTNALGAKKESAGKYLESLSDLDILPKEEKDFVKKLNSEMKSAKAENKELKDHYDTKTVRGPIFGNIKESIDENKSQMAPILRLNGDVLTRSSVCSSFAALVVYLAEKSLNYSKKSVQISPALITPAYLELGMKMSRNYKEAGVFINLGSKENYEKDNIVKLHRPHNDYFKATKELIKVLEERGELDKINIPKGLFDGKRWEISDSTTKLLGWLNVLDRNKTKTLYKKLINKIKINKINKLKGSGSFDLESKGSGSFDL